jgi:hypothetical protein
MTSKATGDQLAKQLIWAICHNRRVYRSGLPAFPRIFNEGHSPVTALLIKLFGDRR